MLTQDVKVNRTLERAEKIVNTILKHLDSNKDCEHCRILLREVFD